MRMSATSRINSRARKGFVIQEKSGFIFLFFLCVGVVLGSVVASGTDESARLVQAIMLRETDLACERTLLELIFGISCNFIGYLLAFYICINSRKGASLVYIVPIVHGMVVASMIVVLLSLSFELLMYILTCVIIPKTLQAYLLLSFVRKTVSYCNETYGSDKSFTKKVYTPTVATFLFVFFVYVAVESGFIYFFRHLYRL